MASPVEVAPLWADVSTPTAKTHEDIVDTPVKAAEREPLTLAQRSVSSTTPGTCSTACRNRSVPRLTSQDVCVETSSVQQQLEAVRLVRDALYTENQELWERLEDTSRPEEEDSLLGAGSELAAVLGRRRLLAERPPRAPEAFVGHEVAPRASRAHELMQRIARRLWSPCTTSPCSIPSKAACGELEPRMDFERVIHYLGMPSAIIALAFLGVVLVAFMVISKGSSPVSSHDQSSLARVSQPPMANSTTLAPMCIPQDAGEVVTMADLTRALHTAKQAMRRSEFNAALSIHQMILRNTSDNSSGLDARALRAEVLRDEGYALVVLGQPMVGIMALLEGSEHDRQARPFALNALGFAYAQLHDFESAWSSFYSAAHMLPNDPVVWSNLGVSALLAKRHSQADMALDRAATLSPASPLVVANVLALKSSVQPTPECGAAPCLPVLELFWN